MTARVVWCLRRALQEGPIKEVADRLGINLQTVRSWERRIEVDRGTVRRQRRRVWSGTRIWSVKSGKGSCHTEWGANLEGELSGVYGRRKLMDPGDKGPRPWSTGR